MKADILFLDVGGIILEIDWKHSLEPLGFTDAASQEKVLSKIRGWRELHLFECGKISSEEFFTSLRKLLDMDGNPALEDAWNKLIVGPLPNADKIFDRYKGKIPICALSNTNISHHQYQSAQFPILKRFDRFFSSYELGHRKPDPEIFVTAAKAMGVDPQRAIFFDDSLSNVKTAKTLGFNAFHTVNSPDETISLLNDFLGF
jgi:HAD superfamily hydrolase (TIGR01509 family)